MPGESYDEFFKHIVGRSETQLLNDDQIHNFFNKEKILVIGAGGSIGSALARRLISAKIKNVFFLDRDESALHGLALELSDTAASHSENCFIADIRDSQSIKDFIEEVRPTIVIHAAALKQVPSCEFYPIEAVRTNIIGTENVLNAAINQNIKKVICLSTDKAVYPINAMGLTKALMEKLMQANSRIYNDKRTIFCATRYGNVAGSRGSVIPRFVELIKKNEPPTITDPEMTRFLMTLNDSVDLVLTALIKGKRGDIFVQKAPSCRIIDLANSIKEILGKSKLKNKIIGIRHGEKKHEVLLSKEEMAFAKEFKTYYQITSDNRDLNYTKFFFKGNKKFKKNDDYNSLNTKILSKEEIKNFLKKNNIVK